MEGRTSLSLLERFKSARTLWQVHLPLIHTSLSSRETLPKTQCVCPSVITLLWSGREPAGTDSHQHTVLPNIKNVFNASVSVESAKTRPTLHNVFVSRNVFTSPVFLIFINISQLSKKTDLAVKEWLNFSNQRTSCPQVSSFSNFLNVLAVWNILTLQGSNRSSQRWKYRSTQAQKQIIGLDLAAVQNKWLS